MRCSGFPKAKDRGLSIAVQAGAARTRYDGVVDAPLFRSQGLGGRQWNTRHCEFCILRIVDRFSRLHRWARAETRVPAREPRMIATPVLGDKPEIQIAECAAKRDMPDGKRRGGDRP